ncbi:unnamed protein product [Mucor hiemalis]
MVGRYNHLYRYVGYDFMESSTDHRYLDKVYFYSYSRFHGNLVHLYAFCFVRGTSLTLGNFHGIYWYCAKTLWKCELLAVLYTRAFCYQPERLSLEIVSCSIVFHGLPVLTSFVIVISACIEPRAIITFKKSKS